MGEAKQKGEDGRQRRRVALALVWLEPDHLVGISKYARQAEWIVDIVPLHTPSKFTSWKGDGIICQLHLNVEGYVEAVRNCPVPKVELAGYIPELGIPVVKPDYYEAGRKCAEHFADRGFTHFLFVGRSVAEHPRYALVDGFGDFAHSEGGAFDFLTSNVSTDPDEGHYLPAYRDLGRDLGERLAAAPKPLAVLAEDASLGVTVVDVCVDEGILIPEEVAVVTAGSSEPVWDLARVPLSSIVPDYEAQGYEAAALLDRLMDGAEPPKEPVLTPFKDIEVRESSDVIAVPNPQVARALLYIKRNFLDARLSVTDIIEATTLSRATLYRQFERSIGRSIAAEIDRLRVEKAADMLTTTNSKAVRIAQACGYASPRHFCESFKRATGMTPTEYRLQRET